MTGRTLTHYQILDALGSGGMGEVYKARDTRLNRFVAIKVLRSDLVANASRKQRFIQEAQAASALNHPNIVTVHDIFEHEGTDCLVMEYVPGKTLDALIPRQGLRLNEALRIAVQVAEGLRKAHAAGIVHRDIKPSNVIVSDDGPVKILDFGLAKLTEAAPVSQDDATLTVRPQTEEGTVMGTVAYMSPEQAEGKKVDARTDIFSFGVLLYEMLSGRRAFAGDSNLALMSAILKEEPKPLENVPPDLDKIIRRCLRKDRDKRYQHMDDLKLSLEEVREESESGNAAAAPATAKRKTWLLPALGGALAAVLASAYFLNRKPPEVAAPPKVSILTSYPGSEQTPALSPDGKQVAFSWNGEKEDNFDIYVKLVDAGTPVRLTQNPSVDSAPAWSPDGRFLAFVRFERGILNGAYYVIPSLGGAERKVAEFQDAPSHFARPTVSWSPDGKSIVIVDTSVKPPAIAMVSVESGERKMLTTADPKSIGDSWPLVSPDGQWLAFLRQENISTGDWFRLPWGAASSATPTRITNTHSDYRPGGSWTTDSKELVISANPGQLYRAAITDGATPTPITNLGSDTYSPSIARQGSRLAFQLSYSDNNLWRADLQRPELPPERNIASTRNEMQPDYSPDGTKVAFISSRSGDGEVWIAGADGSNPVQLTTQGARPTAPRWSPDGRRIAFAKRPGGNADVYVVDAQGGSPKRLTTSPGNDASAYWSHDGRWIYFASNRTGRNEVWKIAADGSSPEVQLTRGSGWRSGESPDGQTLYYQKFDLPGTFKMPVGGGEEQKVLDTPNGAMWHLTGNGIFWTNGRLTDVLHRFDLTTGKDSIVLKLPPETARGTSNFGVTSDGRWVIFVRIDQQISDLMLVENFR
ncbi:MAG: protein kinase [Bryobacteraceae bacterium]|nr:protein kinase [Bryobacteraceae bacterium]